MELKMRNSIVPASTAIQTFRDSGYKNTASALAELLDNSIEAEAENIQVMTFEKEVNVGQRIKARIDEIAIYDDGLGMDPETLGMCLQFGNGTRLSSRSGIGRFGIGLPNASVSQCKRVEVYSWQNGSCHWTYLDVDEVKENAQQEVNSVIPTGFPERYLKHIDCDKKEHGTLIVWKNCDRLDIARAQTLFKHMQSQLCRVYRHFLDTDDRYGRRRKFKLINNGADRTVIQLRANDPLYLMVPNTLPDHGEEATNIMHGEVIALELPYNSAGDLGVVELRFSVALPTVQALGGGSPLGQHYRANTGISFVRAAREIDFGVFGYFNPQVETQRWWGCEIRFEPKFDEVFGVTNNKQAVRGVNYLDLKEFKADNDDWQDLINEDPKLRLRMELSKTIQQNLKALEEIISSRGRGTRKKPGGEIISDKSSKIANEELYGNRKKTQSAAEGQAKPAEQLKAEWTSALLKSDTTLSPDEAEAIAETKLDMVVEKTFDSWPGTQFFSIQTTGKTCTLQINRGHPFFSEMYEPLLKESDNRFVDSLDLLMMAYARTQDELYHLSSEIDEVNQTWGAYVKKFLKKLSIDA